nr:cytosolic factor, phosphatidylinositol/phosphatidylcholine transfer protein [Polyrhizophydium stewartii]
MDENFNGRLGHLTKEEEAVLFIFKHELGQEGFYNPEKHDDHLLLRFLRARKFQLPAAKKMWIDCEKWKNEYGVHTILEDFDFPEYPLVRKLYPRFYHRTDKLGRPIYIEQLGALDVKKLFTVSTDARLLRNHVYEYEKLVHYRLVACSIKANRYLEQSCTILDLKGVALSTFSSVYSLVREVSGIAQNYYPEMLGKMFIINAPMLFTAVWNMVKPLLDEVTVKKINILGTSYKDALLETIDDENLPDYMGGACRCPGGCAHADIGPWNDGTVEGYPKPEFEKTDMDLELFSWGPGHDLPSFDPFCLSIAAYLNLAGADWSINECRTPSISPNELPVLRVGAEPIAGTFNIIRTLKSKAGALAGRLAAHLLHALRPACAVHGPGLDLDSELSPRQRAESQAWVRSLDQPLPTTVRPPSRFIALIEDKLYDALLYTWWMENENYQKSTFPTLSRSLTFFGRYQVPAQLKEKARQRLMQYRDLRVDGETVPEIYLIARDVYRALADKLGDKPFFFGNSPTTLDAIAFGHLSLHAYPSLAVPKLFSLLTFEFPTLIAYCARLKNQIFAAPLVKSPLSRPSLRAILADFAKDPEPYLRFVWEGFQTKMVPVTEKQTKEQRVQAFWKGVSIAAGIAFFAGYVVVNGIVEVGYFPEHEDSIRSDDDDAYEDYE